MKIYLAGPLFTQAERRWNRDLAASLRTLAPRLDIRLPQDLPLEHRDGKPDFAALFGRNIESIDQCDLVLAILDGSDADSGTAWECGYAYAKRKRVVGVRTDFRTSEDEHLNLMLQNSCDVVFEVSFNEDINELSRRLVDRLGRQETANE